MTNFINKYVAFNILGAQSLKWSGTINGVNYYFRGFAALPALIIALLLIIGGTTLSTTGDAGAVIGIGIVILGWIYGILAYIHAIWLMLTTINKRLNALLPDNKVLGWVLVLVPYANIIMSLYLLFANSNIEKHNG